MVIISDIFCAVQWSRWSGGLQAKGRGGGNGYIGFFYSVHWFVGSLVVVVVIIILFLSQVGVVVKNKTYCLVSEASSSK